MLLNRGFTLIEAIVALVLISTLGMALFAWINTNLTTVSRIEDVMARSRAQENILAYVQGLNPARQNAGEQAFSNYSIRWQAGLTEDERDNANGIKGIGLYKVGLYQVRVEVFDNQAQPWFEFSLHQVGYRKVRDGRLPI